MTVIGLFDSEAIFLSGRSTYRRQKAPTLCLCRSHFRLDLEWPLHMIRSVAGFSGPS